jgi:hypothetical protein
LSAVHQILARYEPAAKTTHTPPTPIPLHELLPNALAELRVGNSIRGSLAKQDGGGLKEGRRRMVSREAVQVSQFQLSLRTLRNSPEPFTQMQRLFLDVNQEWTVPQVLSAANDIWYRWATEDKVNLALKRRTMDDIPTSLYGKVGYVRGSGQAPPEPEVLLLRLLVIVRMGN